jgi:hypothetical protein
MFARLPGLLVKIALILSFGQGRAQEALDTAAMRDCLDRERVIANLDREIRERGRLLGDAMAEIVELEAQIGTWRDTARVDPTARLQLIQFRVKLESAETTVEETEALLAETLQSHEEQVSAFNLVCSGRSVSDEARKDYIDDLRRRR